MAANCPPKVKSPEQFSGNCSLDDQIINARSGIGVSHKQSQPPTAESHVPKALQYTKDTVISEHFTLSLWHSRLPASGSSINLTGSPIFTPFSQE
ncbi:uncharacterized protein PHALS_14153 [Plasmopara halstedii]|uniref:Uncharacterized protein n=1 Tax=Plasmopara halstedii TaxID=4781 RepID=A0A0P1AQW0_PLAHL|nr:uncharacterized protein PHALS_14153 [Plasmopara halstedii]CEG43865.1 hypothetical protein PHALS_14153 [Plasmopara halstedii]|eukprot:XP_024580234.1 hypothetical protein PHALS_14153 [Plasmopara halstedii]